MALRGPSLAAWAVLALAVLLAMGPRCGGPLRRIVIDRPLDGSLFDDPTPVLGAAARLPTTVDVTTVEVRLDGVDLVAALGLTPPFSGASGAVAVGTGVVVVDDFQVTTDPHRVDLVVSGLAPGPHDLEVRAAKPAGPVLDDAVAFEMIDPLALVADAIPAAGRGPQVAGAEGVLFSQGVGQPLAAPPVAYPGGGTLRSGFVEVSEAFVAAGSP